MANRCTPLRSTAWGGNGSQKRFESGSTATSKKGTKDCWCGKEQDANLLFPPLEKEEAAKVVEHLLHQWPSQYGIQRARWRLQDVRRALWWLEDVSDAGIYKVLKRLGFSRKKALAFVQSPDPEYRAKWQQVLSAYQEAVENPDEVVILFQDELTYYRRADIHHTWQGSGRPRRHPHRSGNNTQARVTAVLNALTGQILFLQRSKVGKKELAAFYAMVRAAYPNARRIYLVQDNWPVHKLPEVTTAAAAANLTLLFLPTYASWLNPIEKLWRWLRQDVLHSHSLSHDFKRLRREVARFLQQFASGSRQLLHYVGLLSKRELDDHVSVFNC